MEEVAAQASSSSAESSSLPSAVASAASALDIIASSLESSEPDTLAKVNAHSDAFTQMLKASGPHIILAAVPTPTEFALSPPFLRRRRKRR